MKRQILVFSCSALVALGLFFSPASSDAGLIGALKILVHDNDPAFENSIQIAEVQGFESGTGTNVALSAGGATATASTTAFGTSPD